MQHLLPYAVSMGLALASPAFAAGHVKGVEGGHGGTRRVARQRHARHA